MELTFDELMTLFTGGSFFREKKLLRELEQVVKKWKRNSVKFEPQKYKMKISDYIILAILKIFKPIL